MSVQTRNYYSLICNNSSLIAFPLTPVSVAITLVSTDSSGLNEIQKSNKYGFKSDIIIMTGKQTEIFRKFFVYYECIYEDSNSEVNMAGG